MNPLLVAALVTAGLFFAAAALLYFNYLRVQRNDTGFWASVAAALGWLALTLGGVLRTAWVGRLPVGSFSESLIFLVWLLAGGYFFVEYRWRVKAGGAFVLPVAAAGVLFAAARPLGAGAMLPTLRSPWVAWHVALVFVGYTAFALAGLASFLYLLQEKQLKTKRLTFMHFSLPSLSRLEHLSSTLIWIGYPCLSVGIVLGAVWSHRVWGAYVPADPKMLWAVLTWLYYTASLVGRRTWGWRGRRCAILAVVGFAALIFNYFGLSFIMHTVHRF